jgi:hypothetical protein
MQWNSEEIGTARETLEVQIPMVWLAVTDAERFEQAIAIVKTAIEGGNGRLLRGQKPAAMIHHWERVVGRCRVHTMVGDVGIPGGDPQG